MLKKTGIKIELFTNMFMHNFIEKAKKDGISMACKRYFKANNPKIGKAFNPSKQDPRHLSYNLYFLNTDFATIYSFSFLRISQQLVIRFEYTFFDFVELIKGYKTKKSLLRLDIWMARKSQKTD